MRISDNAKAEIKPAQTPQHESIAIEDIGSELRALLGKMNATKGGGEKTAKDFLEDLSKSFDEVDRQWGVAAVVGTANALMERKLSKAAKQPELIGRQIPMANLINNILDIAQRVEDIYGTEILNGSIYLVREMKMMLWFEDLNRRRMESMKAKQAEQIGV